MKRTLKNGIAILLLLLLLAGGCMTPPSQIAHERVPSPTSALSEQQPDPQRKDETGEGVALLFTEPDDLLGTYVQTLATTMPITLLISHFIVGPAVKMLFNNRITPDGGLRLLRSLDQHALSLLKLFGIIRQ